jgi:sigma-B regulation protein RsbU (phosphoserine phosphatase)
MSEFLDRLKNSPKSPEKLALLAQAAQLLNSTIEYEELMKNVLKLVTRAVDAEAATVFRYDPDRKDLRIRFYSGDEEPRQLNIPIGRGFVGWVAEHKEPVLTNSPAEDSRYSGKIRDIQGVEIRSILCYPLSLRGKFFGVIEAINKKEGEFDQSDLDTFNVLSDHIALAIYNAGLYRASKRQALQRKTLFDVSKRLMSPLTLDEVLHSILRALMKVVDFHAGGVYLIDNESGGVESITSLGYEKVVEADLHLKIGEGIVGTVARTGKAEVVPDVTKDDRYIDARPKTRSEIVVPVVSDDKLIGVFNLENDKLDAFSDEDLDILTTFASQAAISIERARLHKYILEQKKIEQQLSIARTIQKTFLPDEVPQIPGYDLWGANIPSGEVGGDYFDFIRIVDYQLGIAVADVSGKGIPAALIMASFRASLIAEIRNNYAIRSICQKVNNLLCESLEPENLEPENFVTAIYGVLDTKNSIFTFANCGHNPGLLLRSDGTIEELAEGGLILGVRPGSTYEERPVYIKSGDILCFFTDGISEAENAQGSQFETRRIIDIIKKHKSLSAAEIGGKTIEAVRSFAHNEHSMDDLTLIIIKRK